MAQLKVTIPWVIAHDGRCGVDPSYRSVATLQVIDPGGLAQDQSLRRIPFDRFFCDRSTLPFRCGEPGLFGRNLM